LSLAESIAVTPTAVKMAKSLLSLVRSGAKSKDRSKDRYRRAAWTGATSLVSRGASLVSALASVPLTIGYLGTQRFALWMTINSFMAMLAFADLGLGNGLLTTISESHGKDDTRTAAKYISSAFFMLLGIGASVLLVLGIIYRITPWARFLGVRPGVAFSEAGPAIAIFFVCFALNLPLGIVQRIQMGFQTGYTSNVWSGFGVLLGFAGLLVCVRAKAGVPWLVFCAGFGPIIATILNGVQLFRSRPSLRPTWTDFQWPLLKQLLLVGSGFLILQLALAMAVGSDNFVIAHLLGSDAVAEYSIAMRIFTIVPMLLSILITPLWPAYGESVARGDAMWAIRALKRSIVVTAVATLCAAVFLALTGRWIITLWVGNRFHQGQWLLSGMGLWMVVNGLAVVVSIFLNGLNRIRVQVISAIAVAASTLTIELLATPKLGLPAMIWSTDISYICFVLIPIAIFFPRFLRDLKRNGQSKTRDAVLAEAELVTG
jgi:O-antigen/teichoic acid export membrane protein